jgi:hypothetical protein
MGDAPRFVRGGRCERLDGALGREVFLRLVVVPQLSGDDRM